MRAVVDKVLAFLPYYANVHRGSGLKSRLSTLLYEEARATVARFFGVDTRTNTVIFTKNATEAINRLALCLPLTMSDVVLTSVMEHHSNDLPWRYRARVDYVDVHENGELDREDYLRKLKAYRSHLKLVALTGASNVTGIVNDVHWLAEAAHRFGARVLIDAAQLAAHRPVNMLPDDHPGHLDFLAVSAHKMYAPFGSGALIGPKAVFAGSPPDHVGGGTVNAVTLSKANWAEVPFRNEAGTPNVVGAVAFAAALEALERFGMEKIARHEAHLTAHALLQLSRVPGVTIYASPRLGVGDRLGVISFNVDGVPHETVAAALAWEAGIGVRSGCFCARPYAYRLLGLSGPEVAELFRRAASSPRGTLHGNLHLPGMVRLSFGLYNSVHEVDAAIGAVSRIAANPGYWAACHAYGALDHHEADADAQRVLKRLGILASRR